jgi:hypothetical protein
MLNRRGFLGVIAGAMAGSVFDPEKLLWVKGTKVWSIPAEQPRVLTVTALNGFLLQKGDIIYNTWEKFYAGELATISQKDFRIPFTR